jgi:hypothetical protein
MADVSRTTELGNLFLAPLSFLPHLLEQFELFSPCLGTTFCNQLFGRQNTWLPKRSKLPLDSPNASGQRLYDEKIASHIQKQSDSWLEAKLLAHGGGNNDPSVWTEPHLYRRTRIARISHIGT